MNNIKNIIQEKVIIHKSNNDNYYFTENDGNWIFDFRSAFLNGESLRKFSEFFWNKYEHLYPFQVGGLELSAIFFVSGIILEGEKRGKNINGFFVRKERKESGSGKIIEGELNNEKIIIVDDLFNSGQSIAKVFGAMQDIGKEVYCAFVFVNFGSEQGNHYLKMIGLKLDYEYTLSDFGLDIFGNSKLIEKENSSQPMIFPKHINIYKLYNANKFLSVMKSNPIKSGKNIIFAGEGGIIISVCGDTGSKNWEYKVDCVKGHKNILSSPIIIEEDVIFGAYDGNIYSINKQTGQVNWKNEMADWIGSSPCYSPEHNLIYIGGEHGGQNNKGSCIAIDRLSGKNIWSCFFNDFVHSSPGYSPDKSIVICGGNDGRVIGIQSSKGDLIWNIILPSAVKGGFTFSSDGDLVFCGCFDNCLYAIETGTGNILWKYETNNIIYTVPLVIGENIFFGSTDKFFYHLNKDGELLKKVRTFGKIFGEPIFIKDGIIAFASNDSYVYIYNYNIKRILFVFENKERINSKMIYDKKYSALYVSDFMNNLIRYNLAGYV